MMFGSGSYCHKGRKGWLIIKPGINTVRLTELMKKALNEDVARVQEYGEVECFFLREKGYRVSISQLQEWNIQYKLIVQEEGELVVIKPGVLHQVVNLEDTINSSINYLPHLPQEMKIVEEFIRCPCPPKPTVCAKGRKKQSKSKVGKSPALSLPPTYDVTRGKYFVAELRHGQYIYDIIEDAKGLTDQFFQKMGGDEASDREDEGDEVDVGDEDNGKAVFVKKKAGKCLKGKRYYCPYPGCVKHYGDRKNIERHQDTHVKGAPKHVCKKCGTECQRKDTLSFHLKRYCPYRNQQPIN